MFCLLKDFDETVDERCQPEKPLEACHQKHDADYTGVYNLE